MRSFRSRSRAGFGSISRRERYQADVFFADLTGTRRGPGATAREAPAPPRKRISRANGRKIIRTLPFAEEGA